MKFDHAFSVERNTPHARECMEKIRDTLSHPKPPGNWWAHEIMSKVAAGEHVGIAAYELAKSALRTEPEREPGQDDEEMAA